jgi:probable HAF family extracellular repeat protein
MLNRYLKALPCVLLCVIAPHAGAQNVGYEITNMTAVPLGTLGGDSSVANDINDHGEIVGWARNGGGLKRAFLYRNGVMHDITVGSMNTAEAHGINNSSKVVGSTTIQGDGPREHPFYDDDGHFMVALMDGAPFPECTYSGNAEAINDSGVIVGERGITCPTEQQDSNFPVRWTDFNAPWQSLWPPTSPASVYAHDVNATGVVAGEDSAGEYVEGGFWWVYSLPSELPVPVGAPPEWYYPGTSRALAINTSAEMVGDMDMLPKGLGTTGTVKRGVYWGAFGSSSRGLEILPNGKNASAHDLNDTGFIVGWADRANIISVSTKRAAVWHATFGIVELPFPPGYSGGYPLISTNYCEALAVNQRDSSGRVQAVGYCELDGKKQAVLWNISTIRFFILMTPPPIGHNP